MDDNLFLSKVEKLYYSYYLRDLFPIPKRLGSESLYSRSESNDSLFRIGLEFEVGNIASSPRAINKLSVLYKLGHIDIGIFITSRNKSVSTKIWHSRNRNGSLEELSRRKFMEWVHFPFIIIGFEPDEWANEHGFLGENGERFKLPAEKTRVLIEKKWYDKYENCRIPKIKKNDFYGDVYEYIGKD